MLNISRIWERERGSIESFIVTCPSHTTNKGFSGNLSLEFQICVLSMEVFKDLFSWNRARPEHRSTLTYSGTRDGTWDLCILGYASMVCSCCVTAPLDFFLIQANCFIIVGKLGDQRAHLESTLFCRARELCLTLTPTSLNHWRKLWCYGLVRCLPSSKRNSFRDQVLVYYAASTGPGFTSGEAVL